jgi:hypothetical protein
VNFKHIGCALALVVAGAASLAAQDSTEALPDSTAAPAAVPSLTVTDAVIAKTVVGRVPQDTAATFPADVGQVACWSIVVGAKAGMTIRHVWFHGGH